MTKVTQLQPGIALAELPEPARPLGIEGQKLWNAVAADYRITNPAAAEILLLACESTDRLIGLRAERKVEQCDGKTTGRLERDVLQTTALIASLLTRLDKHVDHKPRRAPGRPASNFWWTPDNALE
jgi:hypothetical protein